MKRLLLVSLIALGSAGIAAAQDGGKAKAKKQTALTLQPAAKKASNAATSEEAKKQISSQRKLQASDEAPKRTVTKKTLALKQD